MKQYAYGVFGLHIIPFWRRNITNLGLSRPSKTGKMIWLDWYIRFLLLLLKQYRTTETYCLINLNFCLKHTHVSNFWLAYSDIGDNKRQKSSYTMKFLFLIFFFKDEPNVKQEKQKTKSTGLSDTSTRIGGFLDSFANTGYCIIHK